MSSKKFLLQYGKLAYFKQHVPPPLPPPHHHFLCPLEMDLVANMEKHSQAGCVGNMIDPVHDASDPVLDIMVFPPLQVTLFLAQF